MIEESHVSSDGILEFDSDGDASDHHLVGVIASIIRA